MDEQNWIDFTKNYLIHLDNIIRPMASSVFLTNLKPVLEYIETELDRQISPSKSKLVFYSEKIGTIITELERRQDAMIDGGCGQEYIEMKELETRLLAKICRA